MFQNGFLNVNQLSKYLGIKVSTLYSKVESGEIPYYRLGRLIRFNRIDIDIWMENHRRNPSDGDKRVKAILKSINNGTMDIDGIVKKVIEEVKRNVYTSGHGRTKLN